MLIKTRQKMDSWLLLQRITNHKTQTRWPCLLSSPWAEDGCTGYAEAWAAVGLSFPLPGTRVGLARDMWMGGFPRWVPSASF